MYITVTYNEFKMFNGLCRKVKKTKKYKIPKGAKLDNGMLEVVYLEEESKLSCNVVEKKDYYLIANVMECKVYE